MNPWTLLLDDIKEIMLILFCLFFHAKKNFLVPVVCVKSVSFIFLAQIDRIKDPLNGTFEKTNWLVIFHCVPTGSKWMKMVPKNLILIFMLSLIVLKHRQRNFWNITTGFPWPYRVLPAIPARFGNQAYSAGRTLCGQGKPVVIFQKFLCLFFKTI